MSARRAALAVALVSLFAVAAHAQSAGFSFTGGNVMAPVVTEPVAAKSPSLKQYLAAALARLQMRPQAAPIVTRKAVKRTTR